MLSPLTRSPRLFSTTVRALLVLAPALLLAQEAAAQAGTRQTLDTVVSHGARTAVELDAGDAILGKDFTFTGITGSAFVACRQASTGFFCLDAVGGIATIVRWPAPSSSGPGEPLVPCTQLPGVTRRVQCTGMTAEPAGTLWLAATKNNAHSLFKLDAEASCTARVGGYCVSEPYAGRPSLVDIDAFDGTLVPQLGARGVLGLESRQNAVFFTDPAPAGTRPEPLLLASARDWGLQSREEVVSVTFRRAAGATYLLGVTTRDRILQRKLGDPAVAVQVFDIAANRAARAAAGRPAALCAAGTGTQSYEIRSSEKSGDVYLTDRNYCEVLGLDPAAENALAFVASFSTLAAAGLAPAGVAATDVAPEGVSIAAGFSVDLKRCTSPEGCTAIAGPVPGKAAAKLLSVELVDAKLSGITIYRVEGIPDCRYTGSIPTTSPAAALCAAAGGEAALVVGPAGEPARQYLNVTPLLPDEVLQLYGSTDAPPNGLPPLLIPPQYRADAAGGHLFEALFVVPQKGLRFRDTFVLELDVPLLTGAGGEGKCFTPADTSLASLLDWDVVVNVSEIWKSQLWPVAGASPVGVHVARAVNSDCRNPTQVEGDRLSLIPYNLRLTPTTYAPKYTTAAPNGPVGLTENNDAVFARLVQSLYQELEDVRRDYACVARDTLDGSPLTSTNQAAPLSRRTCDSLAAVWANGKPKLDKCIAAAFDPKSSAGDENCQSFVSQLENFRAGVPAGVTATDFANRAGELRTRASAIRHVFLTRFLPSIPANGFCREKGTCAAAAP
jgi:hypothetical protein